MKRVGVLALQGDFIEHMTMLQSLGIEARPVRLATELKGLNGLIIPGGESTTIGKLAVTYKLIAHLKRWAKNGKPIWGTCAGMILLAKDIGGLEQPRLGVMDIVVKRNAFGRQIDSFEVDIAIPALDAISMPEEKGKEFRAVFIRAPSIEAVGPGVEILGRLDDGTIVAARQGNFLASAFHPELTDDTRFHRYFLRMVEQADLNPA